MACSVYWLQCGACGGDTMSLLGAGRPDLKDLIRAVDLEILWQPSLSAGSSADHRRLVDDLLAGRRPLDLLVVEGTVMNGPDGTGRFDTWHGMPKRDLVRGLAARARDVLAAGTCASFGGVGQAGDPDGTGLQFRREERGGLLGDGFRSASGRPVVNLPGCPVHPEVLCCALSMLARRQPIELNGTNSPSDWYSTLVHQGCTRNEYHEFRVEEEQLGGPGCLYFHMGCLGPLTWGPCNRTLWGNRNSKTRAGVPCFGCTRPDFPRPHPYFQTRNIEGVPYDLPDGVDRAHFLAYKSLAAAAAPLRLQKRQTRV